MRRFDSLGIIEAYESIKLGFILMITAIGDAMRFHNYKNCKDCNICPFSYNCCYSFYYVEREFMCIKLNRGCL